MVKRLIVSLNKKPHHLLFIVMPYRRSRRLLNKAILLILVAFFSGGEITASEGSTAITMENEVTANNNCAVTAWIPYWSQDLAVKSFRENIDSIQYLSLFWYYLDKKGQIKKYTYAEEDPSLIKFAQGHGVKVFALVANLPDDELELRDNDWDPKRVGRVIDSASGRKKHIKSLLQLATRLGVDGINIDYEALPRKYREPFSVFIHELGEALHADGKLLAVALHPKTSEDNPKEDNGSHAQDWSRLYPYVDQLHFMIYGEYSGEDYPGPIASPRWLGQVLRYATKNRKVPANKIFMGLPLYAEAWVKLKSGKYRSSDASLTFQDVEKFRKAYGATPIWDSKHSSPLISFKDHEERDLVVWYENSKSIGKKVAVAKKHGVCNVGLWRIGGEDRKLWKHLKKERG